MKKLIQSILGKFGFELRKKNNRRDTMEGVLVQLKRLGVNPDTIIDIGAAFGDWTVSTKNFFPEADYILVEPLIEYKKSLEKLSGIKKIHINAVSDRDGDLTLHVHKDLVGSSIFDEQEAKEYLVKEDREIQTVTLDGIIKDVQGSLLIKIDAQGAELLILKNSSVFKRSVAIILECSLFHSIKEAPLIDVVCSFMKEKGFVMYDIIDPSYRPLDNALSQVNVIFVPETSHLRRNQSYATAEQRQKQNQRMIKRNNSRLS